MRTEALRSGFAGILDQGVLSLTNLAIGVSLARTLSPSNFGVFVVAFTLSLIAMSVQVSLITDPLMIFGPSLRRMEQSRYFAGSLYLQVALAIGLAAVVGGAVLLLRAVGVRGTMTSAVGSLAVAVIPLQVQVFARTVFFARMKVHAALANDLIFSALRLCGLFILFRAGHLTPASAMLAIGAGALVSGVLGIIQERDIVHLRPHDLTGILHRHWRFGRWLLATGGAYWCSGQASLILASALLSPIAAGVMKACQYLAAPLTVTLTGLDPVFVTRAARVRADGGDRALLRFTRGLLVFFGIGAALYAITLGISARPLLTLLYGQAYSRHTTVAWILLVAATLNAASRPAVLYLKVTGQTRALFHAYTWSALVGLSSLAILAPPLGIAGAAFGAALSAMTLVVALGRVRSAPHIAGESHTATAPASLDL